MKKKPNCFEKRIINFNISNLKYTGDGKFWVNFKNGKPRNPDFVIMNISKTRKVIECNGIFWHKEARGTLTKLYEEIDYKCLEIWEDEMEDLNKVKRKITGFINAN